MAMTDVVTFTSLTADTLIVALVRAHNSQGWGDYSEENVNGATIETVPAKMTTLAVDTSLSTKTKNVLVWDAVPDGLDSGGSGISVTNYLLEEFTGSWATLTTTALLTYDHNVPLTPGNTYTYRISVTNVYNYGAVSDSLAVVAGEAPDKPGAPTTAPSGLYVLIDWNLPTENHYSVTEYLLEILASDASYYTDLTYCDGANPTVVSNSECSIPMTVLTASPFNLAVDDEVKARVTAYNERGWSDVSDDTATGTTISTIPSQMAAITRNALTSTSQVVIDWTALSSSPSNGGSAITSYGVQWDQGTGVWIELIGESSDFTGVQYAITTGIVMGNNYQFKVRAKNLWGWGDYSSISQVTSYGIPSQVYSLTTSIDSATGGVKIAWAEPASNGATISAYRVEIKDSGSSWITETTDCDGSDATIMSNLYCIIPMSTLTGGSFTLPVNTLVEVQIRATNSYGDGSYSSVNSVGAKTRTTPVQMSAPTEGTDVTENQIDIDWTALTSSSDTGYSTILGYRVYYDNGGATTPSIFVAETLDTTYTTTGLTTGTTYNFAVTARNIYGESTLSSSVSILARNVPAAMSTMVVTLQGTTDIRLDFTPPNNNGLTIDEYEILIYDPSSDSYVEDNSECDGTAQAKTDEYCDFDIANLISTYSYVVGDLVKGKVRAHNSEGWGQHSSVNTAGQVIVTVPEQMDDPYAGAGTSGTTVVIEWTGLTTTAETGASTILSYEFYWDQGTTSWTDLQGVSSDSTLTSYTLNSLTLNQAYQFRVRAKNAIGLGAYSNDVTITPSDVPSIMPTVTTSNSATYLKIDWGSTSDNGSPITSYKILI